MLQQLSCLFTSMFYFNKILFDFYPSLIITECLYMAHTISETEIFLPCLYHLSLQEICLNSSDIEVVV